MQHNKVNGQDVNKEGVGAGRHINIPDILLFTGFTLLILILLGSFLVSIYFSKKPEYHLYHTVQQKQGDYQYHIAVIMMGEEVSSLNKLEEGIRDAASENRIAVEFFQAEDILKATSYIEMLMASNIDGIITQGINDENFINSLKQLVQKKIPLVFAYSDEQTAERKAFIGTNPFDMGTTAGELVVQAVEGTGKIAVLTQNLTGNNDDPTSKLQIIGFKDVVDSYENIDLFSIRKTMPTLLSAEEIMSEIIINETDVAGVFCNNEKDTIGAAQVVIDMNRAGRIKVVGTGLSPKIAEYIDKGIVYGTIYRNPYKIGTECVKVLTEIYKSESSKDIRIKEYIYFPVEVITRENLSDYFY